MSKHVGIDLALCRLVLAEFVKDVEVAGLDDTKAEWPDLHVTYTHVIAALERTGGRIDGNKATIELMRRQPSQ